MEVEKLNRDIIQNRELYESLPNPHIANALLAGTLRNGSLSAYTVAVTYSTRIIAHAEVEYRNIRENPAQLSDVVLGKGDIWREFLDRRSDRAQKEWSEWEASTSQHKGEDQDVDMAIWFAKMTIKYHTPRSDVGGKIDAIEIDQGGRIRWIERKPHCPER